MSNKLAIFSQKFQNKKTETKYIYEKHSNKLKYCKNCKRMYSHRKSQENSKISNKTLKHTF